MRHSRSAEFDAAWARSSGARWNEHTLDPNDATAIAHRARTLAAAWLPPVADRTTFLTDRCRGRTVLDIGCVAHDTARFDDPAWLHRNIAEAAAACIGVDILEDGIAAMQDAGFDAIVHDLTTGLGPLEPRAPFDVIVAGELIEHVGDLDMLFEIARTALAPDGEMILTTPNPYAPARVRAGQRGIVWENADHIAYLFPAGMAELADRHDLVLTGATTAGHAHETTSVPLGRRLKRMLKGSGWRLVGYDTTDRPGRQAAVAPNPLSRWLHDRRPGRFVGETAIYVVGRPRSA